MKHTNQTLVMGSPIKEIFDYLWGHLDLEKVKIKDCQHQDVYNQSEIQLMEICKLLKNPDGPIKLIEIKTTVLELKALNNTTSNILQIYTQLATPNSWDSHQSIH